MFGSCLGLPALVVPFFVWTLSLICYEFVVCGHLFSDISFDFNWLTRVVRVFTCAFVCVCWSVSVCAVLVLVSVSRVVVLCVRVCIVVVGVSCRTSVFVSVSSHFVGQCSRVGTQPHCFSLCSHTNGN